MGLNLECSEPFIRVREVISSSPWGGWVADHMPEDVRRHHFMAYWPEDRLRRHMEMLKAFGYNAIQVSLYQAWCVGADCDDLRRKQLFRCRLAREMGMTVSLFVWGAAVDDPYDDKTGKTAGQQFAELDWQVPGERARLEQSYRRYREFAPYADRVVTHWIDPGKPQRGGLDALVDGHNTIMRIFREWNPKIHGALSTWFMAGQMGRTYPGYDGPGTIAAHPSLDPQSDIVIGLMNYHSDGLNQDSDGELHMSELDGITKTGRKAAVWGWYTADNEINPALHVRIDAIQKYFRKLPAATRTDVAWHSIDDNFSGLNIQNLYVAGKLMQDPALDAGQLLEEFVAGFVGEENVRPVTAALRAVEQARTRSVLYGARSEDAVAPPLPILKHHKPLPTTWLADTTLQVADAIEDMKSVRLAANHSPVWPVPIEPSDYLDELKAHLDAIIQMLKFLKGVREIEHLQQLAGAPPESVERGIAALPAVDYDPAHTAGMEAHIYKQKLAALNEMSRSTTVR